jgi:hypothetical protein
VTNTIVSIQHADFGMPASARLWLTSLRAVPTTGDVSVSDQKPAFGADDSAMGYESVLTDAVMATGAFAPGTSSWSPPS